MKSISVQPTHKPKLSEIMTIIIGATVAAAVLLTVIPFAAVYTGTVENNAKLSLSQSVGQTAAAIEVFVSGMESRLTNICDEIGISDAAVLPEKLSTIARLDNSIEAVCVYDSDGKLLVCGSARGDLKENGVNLSYDEELFSRADDIALSLPHVQTLFPEYYPWVITIVKRTGELYVAIDFGFDEIAAFVDGIGIGSQGYCYITDEAGNLVYHPRWQMLYSGVLGENLVNTGDRADGSFSLGDTLIEIKTTNEPGWRIVGASSLDEVNSIRDRTLSEVLGLALICCAAALIILRIVLAFVITKPVNALIGSMRGFEKDPESFRYSPAPMRIHEFVLISDSFGQLTWMIRSLLERIRSEEKELRKTELRALQAQINPHFLYNTLDSIQWMCERGKNDSAVRMVSALAKLFRISISRGHELIPLRDELKHAESYLTIQKYRYGDRFDYRFEVEEGLGDYLCVKITLQPLIENAIYHGIEPLVDEGEIIISAKSDGDRILLTVSDNGVGMTAEQIKSVLGKARSDSGGIGVRNVNDRIRIYFGEGYGLSIESEPDEGTRITVRLPKLINEPSANSPEGKNDDEKTTI